MMFNKLLLMIFLGTLPWMACAENSIYRWVDEGGLVHYGDTVPDRYKDNATRKPELKDEHPVIDVGGTAKEQNARQRAREILEPKPAPNAAPAPAPNANAPAAADPASLTCQQQWDQYNASQACFAPYRNANAAVRSEAFQTCKSVPEPPRCE
jgi:hypothetical protein